MPQSVGGDKREAGREGEEGASHYRAGRAWVTVTAACMRVLAAGRGRAGHDARRNVWDWASGLLLETSQINSARRAEAIVRPVKGSASLASVHRFTPTQFKSEGGKKSPGLVGADSFKFSRAVLGGILHMLLEKKTDPSARDPTSTGLGMVSGTRPYVRQSPRSLLSLARTRFGRFGMQGRRSRRLSRLESQNILIWMIREGGSILFEKIPGSSSSLGSGRNM